MDVPTLAEVGGIHNTRLRPSLRTRPVFVPTMVWTVAFSTWRSRRHLGTRRTDAFAGARKSRRVKGSSATEWFAAAETARVPDAPHANCALSLCLWIPPRTGRIPHGHATAPVGRRTGGGRRTRRPGRCPACRWNRSWKASSRSCVRTLQFVNGSAHPPPLRGARRMPRSFA